MERRRVGASPPVPAPQPHTLPFSHDPSTPLAPPHAQTASERDTQGVRVGSCYEYFTVSHCRVRLLPGRVHLQPQRSRVAGGERPSREELLLRHEAQLHAVVQARGDPGRSGCRGHGASAQARTLAAPPARPGRREKLQGEGEELGSAGHLPHLRCKFQLRSPRRRLTFRTPADHPTPLPGPPVPPLGHADRPHTHPHTARARKGRARGRNRLAGAASENIQV